MMVPFVTTSEKRMKNMMKLLDKITEGRGARYIIFKHLPNLASIEKTPEPTDLLLTDPWERVGHEPFDILSELKHAAEKKRATLT